MHDDKVKRRSSQHLSQQISSSAFDQKVQRCDNNDSHLRLMQSSTLDTLPEVQDAALRVAMLVH